jgi:hypothetical protein
MEARWAVGSIARKASESWDAALDAQSAFSFISFSSSTFCRDFSLCELLRLETRDWQVCRLELRLELSRREWTL